VRLTKGTKLVVNGKTYESLLDAAAYYKVNPTTLARRLRCGWTNEQAVGLEEKPQRIGSAKKVVYKGITYANLKHLAEVFNKNAEMLRRKLRDGQTLDEALTKRVEKRIRVDAKSIKFNGNLYPSIQMLVDKYQVKSSVFKKRIKRGWTIEQALEIEDAPPRFRNFEGHARDTKWKTERSTATGVEPVPDAGGYKLYLIRNKKSPKQYVGITIGSLDARLRQHFSAARRGRKGALQNAINFYGEESFTIELISNNARSFEELQDLEINEIAKRDCIKNGYNSAYGGSLGTSKQITVDGRIFPSFAQAAEHYGIDVAVFSLRITRLKWTPEEAVGLIERDWRGKSKTIEIDGVQFSSIRQAALHFDKKVALVYARVEIGWTPKQALDLESPPQTTKFTGKEIQAFGKSYKSISSAAADLGISSEPFRLRMKRGLTSEEAFHLARKKRGDLD
jgi:hypothetical protein